MNYTLRGSTQIVGVIGWPVSHSRSPAMHNAAFAALGLDWVYVPLPVQPERVGEAIRGLRALGLRGINVTVPHKQAVMPWLDEIAPAAQAIHAVNTITVAEDGRLMGDNTDAVGFLAALHEGEFDPAGCRALVLGAGGSARAIVYALGLERSTQVLICNRTFEKANHLAAAMGDQFPRTSYQTLSSDDEIADHLSDVDLVVNCTSLGMIPNLDTTPWPADLAFPSRLTLFDLVYNPVETQVMAQARAAGAQVIGGMGMLVHQGAAAFERWTGRQAPVEIMRQALEEAMKRL